MSLIDDLREVGKFLPVSHTPSDGELKGVVGALALLAEHGPELFSVVRNDTDKLINLMSTGDPDKAPEQVAQEVVDQQNLAQQAEIETLKQQVATLLALSQRTQVGDVARPFVGTGEVKFDNGIS